jgi:hypothetical protein
MFDNVLQERYRDSSVFLVPFRHFSIGITAGT